MYADTPEAREEVAQSVKTQDLLLSARLDKGIQGGWRWNGMQTFWSNAAGY